MLIALSGFTPNAKLTNYIDEIGTKNTADHYLEMAEKFASLAPLDSEDWYPSYYSAYCYTLAAFAHREYSNLDGVLDLAEAQFTEAQKRSPANEEVLCIASMIYSARVLVDPAKRGYKYGSMSGTALEKAMRINSDNPRVLFLMGQSKMFIPANYGGGCATAKPLLELAMEKFKSFKQPNPHAPVWGKQETEALPQKCAG